MFLVALTGGIASGKTTVCRLLEEKGAHILDSDQLAREVVERGKPAWQDIVNHFGEEVLDADGGIDRNKLADIVFADATERAFLETATHPRIFARMAEILQEIDKDTGGKGVAVLDIPLLVEANAGDLFDFNLVVDAPQELQVERLKTDRGSSVEDARSRIRSQVSRERRLACADHVIRNEGSLDELRSEVDEAWRVIIERAGL